MQGLNTIKIRVSGPDEKDYKAPMSLMKKCQHNKNENWGPSFNIGQ
jgi:hypothetical protein